MSRLPLTILAIMVLATLAAAGRRDSAIDDMADRAKADYMYYQLQTVLLDGRPSEAYLINRNAAATNPADAEIAAMLGYFDIAVTDDSTLVATSYDAIRRDFFAAPDIYKGRDLAQLARNINDQQVYTQVIHTLADMYPERIDLTYQYADLLAGRGIDGDTAARDSALAIYYDLESRLGSQPHILARIILSQGADLDTADIIRRIDSYIATAPASPTTLYAASALYKFIHDSETSLRLLDEACAADSTFSPAHIDRANLALEMGDSTDYYNRVQHILRSPSFEFDDKFNLLKTYTGHLYEDSTKTDLVESMYLLMEEMHPGEPELHKMHGAFYQAINNKPGAAEQMRYAVELDPADPENWEWYISSSVAAGDTLAAVDAGRRAMQRFDENVYFGLVTSNIYAVGGHLHEALATLDSVNIESLDHANGRSVFYQTRGDILYQMNMRDSAFTQYELALDYNPDNTMAMNNLAYYLSVAGEDLDRAESLIVKALSLSEPSSTYLDTYAWILFKKKDYPGARIQIDLAIKCEYDEATRAASDGTDISHSVDNDSTATPHTDAAASHASPTPDDSKPLPMPEEEILSADILDHAGDIYFMNGEPDQALQFWKRALALNPDNERIARKVKNKTYFFDD